MKKFFIAAALMVLALSIGVSAEKTRYWDAVLDTAQIEYTPHHGEMSYYIQPYEYDNGASVNDGLENTLLFGYGIAPKTEIKAELDLSRGYAGLFASLQHQLVNKNGFAFALRGQMGYDNFAGAIPGVTLLFDSNVGRQLQFNNDLTMSILNNGNLYFFVENGLYYHISPKSGLKVKLNSAFASLANMNQSLTVAYRVIFADNLNYTLNYGKDFNSRNHKFENVFEYKPARDLKLTGDLAINTADSNWLLLRADKALNSNFSVIGEFEKELEINGLSTINVGVNYKF